MSVMTKISEMIRSDSDLENPSEHKKFCVSYVGRKEIIIEVGQNKTPIRIPAYCFESIPIFLKNREWVKIGSIHDTAIDGTLDEYVRRFTNRSAASYVAPIMERAGIVEINRTPPARLRLKK